VTGAIAERIESGPGRRDVTLPVRDTYSLSELLPRRASGNGYRVSGEMGPQLARAIEGAFGLLERGYGPIAVRATSKMLTPRWQRVTHALVRHGLARTLTLSLPHERGIPLYYFDIDAAPCWHATDGGQPDRTRYARGVSDDYDHALAKCVGESLERGSLLYYRMADMIRGSARSLRTRGMPFVEPRALSIFSRAQIERRPALAFDDDSIFQWVRCRSLVSSEDALVPAQLVHWNYPIGWGDVPEPILREQNSHGAAAFYSQDGAILSGLLECLQRDGFFRHWLRRIAPPRIATRDVTRPATVRLLESARDVGLEPMLVDITSELGVPTCLCVLARSDGESPAITMGASCRIDGETAIHDALLEAASVHHVLATNRERVRAANDRDPLVDASFDTDHRLAFWANPEHAHHLSWFLAGPTKSLSDFSRGWRATASPRAALDQIIDVLRQRRIAAWFYAAKHAALDELGFATARVIVPDLLPMYCVDRDVPLGMARAEEAAQPPWPHPFP
jgi:ribosomal protein S12 methylthiotransferase accessory factor